MTPNTKHTSIEPDESKSQPRMGWVSGFLIMLGLLKFGIPIILQDQVEAPSGILEWIFLPWPMQYGNLLLVLWALWAITQWPHRTRHRSIFLLVPMGWFTLQLASTWGSIDRELSWMMVGHFLTLLALFYSGFFLLSRDRVLSSTFLGPSLGLVLCLWTATEQRLGGLEATRQMIYSQPYWQETYPEDFLQKALEDPLWLQAIRRDETLLQQAIEKFHLSSGLAVAGNLPSELKRDLGFLEKIGKDRIFGTLFYPNALASGILLFLPLTSLTVWRLSQKLQAPSRWLITGTLVVWGVLCIVWSGSKGGWLVGMISVALFLLASGMKQRAKVLTVLAVLFMAGTAFSLKFKNYFEQGATSLSARWTYWEAGWKSSMNHPLLGSGPGTFVRVFSRSKPEDAEMARLAHNDYLQQASDSGWIAALLYLAWIVWPLIRCRPQQGLKQNPTLTVVWIGLCAWSIQNTIEFGLYIPALSWPFFLLLGWLWGRHVQESTPSRSMA